MKCAATVANAEMSVTCLTASPLTFKLFAYGEVLMNRIYRRVWNRQLNALVVASELATGDSGGSAARDPRAFLLMPTTLALALLCVLASGHAGASESISRCVICRLLQPSTPSRCQSRSMPR